MPPKKLKDLSSAPVYGMAHEQQVRLLSDALLREYMHRRGYLSTLKAFDEENPRDAETISSRALMADLMALDPRDQQRLKSEGIETIMEMLCDLRVERRLEAEELVAAATKPLPEAPTAEAMQSLRRQVEETQRAAAAAAASTRKRKDPRKSSSSSSKKKSKKAKKRGGDSRAAAEEHKPRRADPVDGVRTEDGVTLDDLLGSNSSSRRSSSSGSSDGADDHHKGKHPVKDRAAARGEATAPAWLAAGSGSSGDARGGGASAVPKAKNAAAGPAQTPEESKTDDAVSDEDEDGEEGGRDEGGGVEGGTPLDADTAEAVCRLLFGRAARTPPVSFLQQGLTFDDNELEYALVQWRRGPGAVVAVVQSLVISLMFEKEVYVNVKARQLDCLRRALSTILFRAQPNPGSIVLVNGRLRDRHPQRSFARRMFSQDAGLPSAFHLWTGFGSSEEVEETLGEFVREEGEQWMAGKGCGLWCFLLSVCLSRGGGAIAKDLSSGVGPGEAAATCLVDEATGDGKKELLHLMLTGRATANPQPRGGGGGSQLSGLLDGDGASGSRESWDAPSGALPSALTSPGYPSWVVHHRGHYSNLFMKKDARKAFRQKRELSGNATAELFYWDALTEDDEFTLTVEVSSSFGATAGQRQRGAIAASSASFVTAAVQQVPDWARATVDWHGEVTPKT